jgi:hypothetical protein
MSSSKIVETVETVALGGSIVMVAIVVAWLAACAGDPYLRATIDCVGNAATRAQADACRAKLQDAGIVVTGREGGPRG